MQRASIIAHDKQSASDGTDEEIVVEHLHHRDFVVSFKRQREREWEGHFAPFLLSAATAPKNPCCLRVSSWPWTVPSRRMVRAFAGDGASFRWLGFLLGG